MCVSVCVCVCVYVHVLWVLVCVCASECVCVRASMYVGAGVCVWERVCASMRFYSTPRVPQHTVGPLVIKMESSWTHSPIMSMAICLGPALGSHSGSSNWTSTAQNTSQEKTKTNTLPLVNYTTSRWLKLACTYGLTLIGRIVEVRGEQGFWCQRQNSLHFLHLLTTFTFQRAMQVALTTPTQ